MRRTVRDEAHVVLFRLQHQRLAVVEGLLCAPEFLEAQKVDYHQPLAFIRQTKCRNKPKVRPKVGFARVNKGE